MRAGNLLRGRVRAELDSDVAITERDQHATHLHTAAPTAQFTSLHDGSRVSYNQQVTGTVSGIPAGTYTWLVVEPSLTPGYYWPQTGPLNPEVNGQFRALTYIGQSATQNSGEEFTLMIVQASRTPASGFTNSSLKRRARAFRGFPMAPIS